jgi:acetyltransferase-like isoleucine patch superfamily enzyme
VPPRTVAVGVPARIVQYRDRRQATDAGSTGTNSSKAKQGD